MEMFNLLSNITVYGETYNVYLDWIGKIIQFLISGVGSVGVGIIVFSLILKLIVLPFDVYQRIAMRKQNIKMKENQAKMERLQKQYANNKEMYNQKVMEMYKESGISMFSSCLPMILSMVIFFVAIGAFNVYAQYSAIENYNDLVNAYNAKILSFCPEVNENTVSLDGDTITVKADDKEVFYTLKKPAEIDFTANDYEYIKTLSNTEKFFYSNTENEASYYQNLGQEAVVEVYENEVAEHTNFFWIKNIWVPDSMLEHPVSDWDKFSQTLQQSAGCGKTGGVKFDVNGAQNTLTQITEKTNAYRIDTYTEITAKLSKQQAESNGYFILIALSIGTILLQQFVSMRSQKEQQQFSTVDGQGASQQKTTMIVMTGMFAIFSFMYSSAFSIYMITSNVFSLISTLIINKVVDTTEAKKELKAMQEKHNQRFPGRRTETDKENKKK